MPSATRRTKVAFWLLLGLSSTAVAEVVSGASPFVLFSAWGLLATVPVYLLHAVFLAGVVHRYAGALRLEALYLAGALFGLYEAYLTKVLWSPTWEPIPVRVGGVHVFETALLVLLWHPMLAFIVPLLVTETLATRSRLVLGGLPAGLGARLRGRPARWVAGAAVLLGAVQGATAAGAGTSLASSAGTAAVLVVALALWRRRVGADRHSLAELLPTGGELRVLGGLLAAMYVLYGIGLRPAQLPGLGAQATVWALYLAVGSLLYLQLRRDRNSPGPTPTGGVVPLATVSRNAAVYVVAVGLSGLLLRPLAMAVYLGFYLATLAVGGSMLVRIVGGLRSPQPAAP